MTLRIREDSERFKKIVRSRIREDLGKYVINESILGNQGNKKISIPIPRIDIPRFRFDDKQGGGTGQGEGREGDPIGEGKNRGKAGSGEGEKSVEVEVTIDEMVSILGERLKLPNLERRGKKNIKEETTNYNQIRRVGPEGLRHFKRTYKKTLAREIAQGSYYPGKAIVPTHSDKRFRAPNIEIKDSSQACIIYIMDVSGSMTEREKEIVRIQSFWMDAWIRKQYGKDIDSSFIIHDTTAKEVSREDFFRIKESGGTTISSAYELCDSIMKARYNPEDWNIYVFHFSDGDNFSDDNDKSIEILNEKIIPKVNLFGYGQVINQYGSGNFIKEIENRVPDKKKVRTSKIMDKDSVIQSIGDLLGKGLDKYDSRMVSPGCLFNL
jgi:uncharacterized protein